jgi:hypothetical protein
MSALSSFNHQPLPDASSYIRVIRILPTSTAQWIKLRIEAVSLQSDYKCLSYVWGADAESNTILINDQVFMICDSLHAFLLEALRRNPQGTNALWIDAISINQTDIDEKNVQVALMGQIYQNANRVIAWLGHGDEAMLKAFKYVKQRVNTGGYALERRVGDWNSAAFAERDQAIAEMSKHGRRKTFWDVFDVLASATYFSRVWIVQEIILARELVLWYGSTGIASRSLEDLCAYIMNTPGPGQDQILSNNKIMQSPLGWVFHRRITAAAGLARAPFASTFRRLAGHGCQNTADKVYGLKALDEDLADLQVDYKQDPVLLVPQVYECGFTTDIGLGQAIIRTLKLRHDGLFAASKDYFTTDRWWSIRIQDVGVVGDVDANGTYDVDWADINIPEQEIPPYTEHIDQVSLEHKCNAPHVLHQGDILLRAGPLNMLLVFRANNDDMTASHLSNLIDEIHLRTPEGRLIIKSDLEILRDVLTNFHFESALRIREDHRCRVSSEAQTDVGEEFEVPLALERMDAHEAITEAFGSARLVLNVDYFYVKVNWRALLALWRACDEEGMLRGEIEEAPVGSWDEETLKKEREAAESEAG